jgi:hypothetical protein
MHAQVDASSSDSFTLTYTNYLLLLIVLKFHTRARGRPRPNFIPAVPVTLLSLSVPRRASRRQASVCAQWCPSHSAGIATLRNRIAPHRACQFPVSSVLAALTALIRRAICVWPNSADNCTLSKASFSPESRRANGTKSSAYRGRGTSLKCTHISEIGSTLAEPQYEQRSPCRLFRPVMHAILALLLPCSGARDAPRACFSLLRPVCASFRVCAYMRAWKCVPSPSPLASCVRESLAVGAAVTANSFLHLSLHS